MRHRVRTRSCVEHLHDLRRRRSAHGARLIPRDVAAAHGAPREMGHAQARNKQSGAGASRARGRRSWRRSHRCCRRRRHRQKKSCHWSPHIVTCMTVLDCCEFIVCRIDRVHVAGRDDTDLAAEVRVAPRHHAAIRPHRDEWFPHTVWECNPPVINGQHRLVLLYIHAHSSRTSAVVGHRKGK